MNRNWSGRILDSVVMAGATAGAVASVYGFIAVFRLRQELSDVTIFALILALSAPIAFLGFTTHYILILPSDGLLNGVKWRSVARQQEKKIVHLEHKLRVEEDKVQMWQRKAMQLQFELTNLRNETASPAYVPMAPVDRAKPKFVKSPVQVDMETLVSAVWATEDKAFSRRRFTSPNILDGTPKLMTDTRYRKVTAELERAGILVKGSLGTPDILNPELKTLDDAMLAIAAFTGVSSLGESFEYNEWEQEQEKEELLTDAAMGPVVPVDAWSEPVGGNLPA